MGDTKKADLAGSLITLLGQLEKIRQPYEEIWQDVADHIIPIREDIRAERDEGERQAQYIYDTSPVNVLTLFADGLAGYTIPQSSIWFRLTLEIAVKNLLARYHPRAMTRGPLRPSIANYQTLQDVPQVRAWLQETAAAFYQTLGRTNFYSEMSAGFEDGGSIGTATLYMEEDEKNQKPVFTCNHPGQIYIAEDKYGQVDTVFRKDRIEAKKLAERFGFEKLSPSMKQAAENEPFKRFSILKAVYPRTLRKFNSIAAKDKPFASVWVDLESRTILNESGYDINPNACWRYRKSSHETYGRSPAMMALYDIMGLHTMAKTMLGAAHLSVNGPYNVPQELEGKVDITPHGFNFYGPDHKRVIAPVHTAINYPVGVDREEKKREAIEKHFHIDFFMMLARAPRQMTATEILERQGEKAALLSTATGRLGVDWFNPIFDRIFAIEYDAGRLPPPPPIVMEYAAGSPIGVDYIGPLMQIQKSQYKTRSITQGLAAIQPLATMFPEVLDLIDPDETGKEILESYNYPQKAIRDNDVVMEIRQARAQREEAMAKQAQIAQGIEGVKGLAQADQASGGKLWESAQAMMEAGNA